MSQSSSRVSRIPIKTIGVAFVIVFSLWAQNTREATDAAIDAHLVKARTAAGFDFTGTLARLCVAPPRFPLAVRDGAPGPAPARETWYIEPAKVFDNLYFVGSKIHNSWALTSSEGIIILDTLFTYNSEEEIVGGLKKLGLDPAQIKYVIITHAMAITWAEPNFCRTGFTPVS